MEKLSTFQNQIVTYVETVQVREGVEADSYLFSGNSAKDLAVVRVAAGYETPLQRIVKGEKTIEGYMSGKGKLTIVHENGSRSTIVYPESNKIETSVAINDTMQWSADTDLVFYEICWPPYKDARLET